MALNNLVAVIDWFYGLVHIIEGSQKWAINSLSDFVLNYMQMKNWKILESIQS